MFEKPKPIKERLGFWIGLIFVVVFLDLMLTLVRFFMEDWDGLASWIAKTL